MRATRLSLLILVNQKMKNLIKYNKDGTLRFYNLMCWLEIMGHAPVFKYKKGGDKRVLMEKYREVVTFGSFGHLIRIFLCYFNIHSPFASYAYDRRCWVCGHKLK